MSFIPSDLGASLVIALDVHKEWLAGNIWQDSGKTVPATAMNDPVAVITDSYSGLDWTCASATLVYDGVAWCIQTSGSGTISTTIPGLSPPFTSIARWTALVATGNYAYELSLGANQYALGYDNSSPGHLFSFNSAGFQTSSGIADNSPHIVTAVVNGGSGILRRDGVQVASGSNDPMSAKTALWVLSADFGGGDIRSYTGRISRMVLASSVISGSTLTDAETWAGTVDEPTRPGVPYLFFSFNKDTEQLAVWDSSDWLNFNLLIDHGYSPSPSGTFRDPVPVLIGTDYYCGHTTGSFGKSRSFNVAHFTSFPLLLEAYHTVDCSAVVADVDGARCWFSDFDYNTDTGVLTAFFSGSDDGGSTFVNYETHATTPFTSWSTATALGGSYWPNPTIDAHIRHLGSTYVAIAKDEAATTLFATYSSSLISGYNTGHVLTEAGTFIEGGGMATVPSPGSGIYFFANRYDPAGGTVGVRRFTTTDDFATLTNEQAIVTDRGTPANGYAWPTQPSFVASGALLNKRRRILR